MKVKIREERSRLRRSLLTKPRGSGRNLRGGVCRVIVNYFFCCIFYLFLGYFIAKKGGFMSVWGAKLQR